MIHNTFLSCYANVQHATKPSATFFEIAVYISVKLETVSDVVGNATFLEYGRSLEEDVKYQTSGDFEDLLTALMKVSYIDQAKIVAQLRKVVVSERFRSVVA
jgi:hypothetical protein